jgi:hypothetical protein
LVLQPPAEEHGLIAFWNPLIESRSLSMTWINPTALIVGIVVGCTVSLLTRRRQSVESTTIIEESTP